MKHLRLLTAGLMLAFTLNLFSVPAKRGVWKMLPLKNGKEVRAQLMGDEWFHFYVDEAGNPYVEAKHDKYKKISKKKLEKMRKKTQKKRESALPQRHR